MRLEAPNESGDWTVSQVQRVLILKTFPGFARLEAPDLALLASVTRERFFPAGTQMLTPGVPVSAFYLLVDGKVQMYHGGHPSQVFGARAVVGGLAALTRDPEGAHAVALEDTLALEMDREDMQDVFEDSFRVLLGVLGGVARTLRDLQKRVGGGAAVSMSQVVEGIDVDRELGLVERMFFLRKTANFGYARIEALAELAAEATQERFPPGTRLWSLGDPADFSLMLLAGEVECHAPDTEPFSFSAGFVVGGLDSLGQEPRWYDLVAKTEVCALRMRRAALYDVLEDNIEMAMELLRTLARGLTTLIARMAAKQ